MASPLYKTKEFQEQHKFALLKILIDAHKLFKGNNYILNIPKSIEERSKRHLEASCDIVEWFKENYNFDKRTELINYAKLIKAKKKVTDKDLIKLGYLTKE